MPAATLIKRYANTRLYDAEAGRYVSTDELRAWALHGRPFLVRDAVTQEDITRLYAPK